MLLVAAMAVMGPAYAQGSGERPPKVEDEIEQRDPGTDPAERPTTLPLTGADLTAFVLAGSAAFGGGAVLVHRTRARRADH
jgi:LPXTG-motif cell wall-anchored protein